MHYGYLINKETHLLTNKTFSELLRLQFFIQHKIFHAIAEFNLWKAKSLSAKVITFSKMSIIRLNVNKDSSIHSQVLKKACAIHCTDTYVSGVFVFDRSNLSAREAILEIEFSQPR